VTPKSGDCVRQFSEESLTVSPPNTDRGLDTTIRIEGNAAEKRLDGSA
jgi:hypothetical protein